MLDTLGSASADVARQAHEKLLPAERELAAVVDAVTRIVEIVDEEGAATQAEIDATMWRALVLSGAVLIGVVLVVVPLTLLNSHSITQPIAYARRVAQGIAGGDLTHDIRIDGRDESADLLRALDGMQDALRTLVGDLRDSAQSIHTASSEIAAGSGDLSNRTEQTAGNLQETASSMEELTGAVAQSADAHASMQRPRTNSIARYTCPSGVWPVSNSCTMPGCESLASARHSCRNRCID